jgi:cytochrome c oxidase assembly protein subunit 15
VLGRLIGLVFFLPFLAFVVMGKVKGSLAIKLSIGLVLGGLQGLMGWYMVMSGLVDIPRVSHYRLAAHLLLAMLILCYLCWLIFELREKQSRVFCSPLFSKLVYGLAGASVLQILYGAFTAGSRAGYGYNTYPLMNESWIAEAVFYLDPWWLNLFENTATIQFMHRWLGALVLLLALAVLFVSYLDDALKDLRKYTMTLMVVISAQFLLGVFTLVQVVPIGLASMHQFGACVLLIALVRTLYIVKTSR